MDMKQAWSEMVRDQIERRGLRAPHLLEALRRVPRHEFVPAHLRASAYDDCPLPIGCGQTISQPYIVALMTQLLALQGTETVLEIGTGSGYQAALLACLAREVHSVERIPELAQRAAAVLLRLGFDNVCVHTADGSEGWPPAAPYQGILITAAAPAAPPALLSQLAVGGCMVLPVGGRSGQILQRGERTPQGMEWEDILPVSFVPLRGQQGWDPTHW